MYLEQSCNLNIYACMLGLMPLNSRVIYDLQGMCFVLPLLMQDNRDEIQ